MTCRGGGLRQVRIVQESGIAASSASTNIVHATTMQIVCAADRPYRLLFPEFAIMRILPRDEP